MAIVTMRTLSGLRLFILSSFLNVENRVLKGAVKTRLNEIFQSVAVDKEWIIKALEIAPDRVHLLVEYDSKHSIGQVAQAFKGRSSRYLRKEFSHLLKLPSL